MNNNEQLINTLNELVRINYDRVLGYEKAIEDIEREDIDLKAVFNQYAEQSRNCIIDLRRTIQTLGGEPATDSTTRGKLFRIWMDFKATLVTKGRESMLDSCAFGEEAAQSAYNDVLKAAIHLPDDIRIDIVTQQQALKAAHETIAGLSKLQEKLA